MASPRGGGAGGLGGLEGGPRITKNYYRGGGVTVSAKNNIQALHPSKLD
jgi:hypothetical protein